MHKFPADTYTDYTNRKMVQDLNLALTSLNSTLLYSILSLSGMGKQPPHPANLNGYDSISIHANHSQMVKFESPQDNGFKKLVGELQRWKKTIEVCRKLALWEESLNTEY